MDTIDLNKYERCKSRNFYKKLGKVVNVVGLTVESAGPDAILGDTCRIYTDVDKSGYITAEVVGFKDGKTLLMPYEVTNGIGLGALVENQGVPLSVRVGPFLLGQILDGMGRPLNGEINMTGGADYSVVFLQVPVLVNPHLWVCLLVIPRLI